MTQPDHARQVKAPPVANSRRRRVLALYGMVGVWALAVAGCSVLLPQYHEPQDGPRATLRVIYGGGGAKFHPGRDCKPRKYNSGQDVMGLRIPGLVRGRRLAMPAPPEGDPFYDEVYVRADAPLTVFFAYRHEYTASQNLSPDGKGWESDRRIEYCDSAPFSFVPEPDGYYEVTFSRLGRSCASVLVRIVERRPGEFQRQRMNPLPARACR